MSKYIIKESTLREMIAKKVKKALFEAIDTTSLGKFDKIIHSHSWDYGLIQVPNTDRNVDCDTCIKVYEIYESNREPEYMATLYGIDVNDMDKARLDSAYNFFCHSRLDPSEFMGDDIEDNEGSKRMWEPIGRNKSKLMYYGRREDVLATNKIKKAEAKKRREARREEPSDEDLRTIERGIGLPTDFGSLDINDEY